MLRSAVVSGKSTTANDSCELTNEVLELRAELAKSNDKIAEMDRKFAQLNATVSGKPIIFMQEILYIVTNLITSPAIVFSYMYMLLSPTGNSHSIRRPRKPHLEPNMK